MNDGKPYNITREDAAYLLALKAGVPVPARSTEDLQALLVQVCNMAQSVSDNCRQWLEEAAIIYGDVHPYRAEQLNIPTLEGAMACAVTVPRVDPTGCCATCAFRVGSPANQTEAVADDVLRVLGDGEVFYCHHDLEDDYEGPRQPCVGWVRAKQQQQPTEGQNHDH